MVKKFEIWNSEIKVEDYQDYIEEELQGYDEDEVYQAILEMNNGYLDDERMNLNKLLDHQILLIADPGLWDGRRRAYKLLNTHNIKDILYAQTNNSEIRWYCDGYNICCDEVHHDGTNHYIYREIKNSENIQSFLYSICCEKDWKKKLNYYTRSIASDVAKVYGIA